MHEVESNWRDKIFTVNHVNVIWGISGMGKIVIDGKEHDFPQQHLAVLLPGMKQEIYGGEQGWEYCWWTMDGPMAVPLVREFGLSAEVREAGTAPRELIAKLVEQITQPDFGAEMAASCIAYQLLTEAASVAALVPSGDDDDGVVAAARDQLHANWANPSCNVETIADELGVHRSTLSRRFRAETGTTVIEYLVSMRVQNAMNLLQNTSLPIADVADRCGFTDNAYFCRVFKQRLGATPRDFRKRRVGTW
jgi:AraC-like DNA-binding protein